MPLPRCLDAARLWNSLEGHGLEGESLVRVFRALFQSEGGAEERWLLAQSRDWGIKLIAEQLTHFDSVSQWGVLDQMRSVLEATGDIEVLTGEGLRLLMAKSDLGKIVGGDTAGAYLHAMTRQSTERGPTLTEDAWQAIDAVTELPTLRILCALLLSCGETANAHFFTRLFLEDSRFWPRLLRA